MTHICHRCIEDLDLKEVIRSTGAQALCNSCGEEGEPTISMARLADIVDPIFKLNYDFGDHIPKPDGRVEQDGINLSHTLQELLGQYLDCEAELIRELKARYNSRAPGGEPSFYDDETNYISQVGSGPYLTSAIRNWSSTLRELKHLRRFFSPSATKLFSTLFAGVDNLDTVVDGHPVSVTRTLDRGTILYRARVCRSKADAKKFSSDPFAHIGPPPGEQARSGRMNPQGVTVLYCATDAETCLAEMRPAIGMQIAVATFEITDELKILDFARLELAHLPDRVGVFNPSYVEERNRAFMLQYLHTLITKPVTPGREMDYLITQTMAEYLAHVHEPSFDGIAFSSAQNEGGMNIVLFPKYERDLIDRASPFSVRFNAESGRVDVFNIDAINYAHSVDRSAGRFPIYPDDLPF